jgi:hypothetical protein
MNLDDMSAWLTNVYFKTINPSASGTVRLAAIADPEFVKAAIDKIGVDHALPSDPPQLSLPPAP